MVNVRHKIKMEATWLGSSRPGKDPDVLGGHVWSMIQECDAAGSKPSSLMHSPFFSAD